MYKSMLNSIKGFIGNDRNDIEFLVSAAQNRWSQLIVLVYLFKYKSFIFFQKDSLLIFKKHTNEPRFWSHFEALNVSVESLLVRRCDNFPNFAQLLFPLFCNTLPISSFDSFNFWISRHYVISACCNQRVNSSLLYLGR